MRMYNKLFAMAIGACSFFAACDNGSTSVPEDKTVDAPSTPSFNVSSCQEVTDAAAAAQLESAKANIDDILIQLGDGDLKNAQIISAQTKSAFKAVLDKYPSNCEAQLGYALSIVTDLINNKQINAYVDTVTNKMNLADVGVDDINQLLIAGDGKRLSTMSQEAIAAAIPSLDSAIIYMKNIVADDKFVCHYTYNDRLFELDRGEFAPAVSVLYIAKALLTFGASLDLDFAAVNGRYDWLNDLDQRETATKAAVDQIISLMDKSSSFTTVYSSWKSRYKDIPNLLDTAITYVEIGLQYGIEESKTGIQTQQNDPYIVGNDEFADVSAKDFQTVIDSLEHFRQKIHTGFTVTFPHGTQITVNPAKFFDITDGWQDFLPYHKINDYTQWNTPVDAFYWDTDPDYSYAENEYEDALYDQLNKTVKTSYFYASLYNYTGWNEDPYIESCVHFEVNGSEFYFCSQADIINCTITFNPEAHARGDAGFAAYFPEPVKLSSGVCKVENGQSLFATPVRHLTPNAFYFTDASGKKTISYQALNNGKLDEASGYYKDYTLDDLQNLIFFPDITFGGILPGMTVEKFWNFLKTEFRDDEDEDWTLRFE